MVDEHAAARPRAVRGATLLNEASARAADACPVRALHPEAIARAEATLRPAEEYADLAETFRALGDVSRAKMVHALLSGELCVCDLAALTRISESAVSQHLRLLRALRVVRKRKVGRVVYYSLDDACIRALLAVALTHLDDPARPAPEPHPAPPARGRHGTGHRRRRALPQPTARAADSPSPPPARLQRQARPNG